MSVKDQTRYTYDSSGRLITISDKNGNTPTLSYSDGLLSAAVDAAGRRLDFSYDSEHRLQSIT